MPDSDIHQLVAAYALNALDQHDRDRFERHLAGCEACAHELGSLRETSAALAYGMEAVPPPPELRERVLAAARRDRGATVIPFRRRRLVPALGAATAVAAAAAIVLGLWGVSLSGSLDDERAALAATQRALTLVADPGADRISLDGAEGSLLVGRDGTAALVVCGVPAAPDGKTYEAWVIRDSVPARAGEFAVEGACAAHRLTEAVPPGTSVAVTVERRGGVDQPTGDPVLAATRSV